MSAVLSVDRKYRYRLDREVASTGVVFAYFGINPSTADALVDDATITKLTGFTKRLGGKHFIVGNVFAYRATDVKELAQVDDPVGFYNLSYLREIIREADLLIPCWGCESKVAWQEGNFETLHAMLVGSGKPIKVFGVNTDGSPKHPLMLGYDTGLIEGWELL